MDKDEKKVIDNNSTDSVVNYMIEKLVKPKNSSGAELFQREDVKEPEFSCSTCHDKGFYIDHGEVHKCTNCKSYFIKNDVQSELVEEKSDELQIPTIYRNMPFTKDKLLTSESIDAAIRQKVDFKYYAKELERLLDYYKLGIKLDKSYIIMSPQGTGKNNFVYSCMEAALKKGLSVAPYLDTEELLVMRMTSPLQFKELIRKDVLFVKALVSYLDIEDTEMIKYIVDKRSRLDLPTVVISRFNMKYIGSIEPHLTSTIGLAQVEKYDYGKLQALKGVFMSDYQDYKKDRDNRLDRLYRVHRLPCVCQMQQGRSNYNGGFPLRNEEVNSKYYKDDYKKK